MGLTGQKTNRLWLFLLLACLIWSGPIAGVAQAQEPLTIQEMYLSVWPEYYTPDVVVSQAALFVNESEGPVGGEIWFQLPKAVEPVTLTEVQEGLLPRYFEVVDKGDHQLVCYELNAPLEPGDRLSLLLEYTYPRFQEAGQRRIPVEFVSKYPIEQLAVEIKQPLRSTDFDIVPGTETKSIDSDGFDVYHFAYSNVEADRLLEFEISYYKEDNLPSLDPEPAVAAGNETREQGMNSTTVALLVIVFIALLGVTLLLALRSNQSSSPAAKGKKAPDSKSKGAPKGKPQKGTGSKEKQVTEPVDQRKKLRKMLMEGKINEKTYEKLLAELDKDN